MNAKQAWLFILGGVVAWEVLKADTDQLLSHEADRWIEAHPVLARAGILMVALHLANMIPDSVDALHLTGVGYKRIHG